MKSVFHFALTLTLLPFGLVGCRDRIVRSNPESQAPGLTSAVEINAPSAAIAPQIQRNAEGLITVEPLPVPRALQNPWSPELEQEFWQRANQVIRFYGGKKYGNTHSENEKRSYPLAMFDFLAGNRAAAIAFLQSDDTQPRDHEHTAGIDYYYSFTLKGQIRKYFFFASFLDPAYRQRMFEGAKNWTAQDPNNRSHPLYGKGKGGEGWGPEIRGSWVDSRNTENLRAMRETSVYLMAEETGNEAVRQLYKTQLQQSVETLYHIGMGEWDSENYHGHTIAAYLNLYDFAKDPEVKQFAKAGLDWLFAAGAVKYYRGGFAGPTKRDYGKSNVVFGSAAARFLWLYFGDAIGENPQPERDLIHGITSAYRPPLAIVNLARKQFQKPVELLSTKPIYETWKKGAWQRPWYWETTFFGNHYQLGSLVAESSADDVSPFKLLAENSQRGVDYFVANTGGDRVLPQKNPGDQIAQSRNLAIWLRPADKTPFFFQLPKTAQAEIIAGIWFFQLEKTWLAIYPINLDAYTEVPMPEQNKELAELYQNEKLLKATPKGNSFAGFAILVGEPESHGNYNTFKQVAQQQIQMDLSAIASGTVQLMKTEPETNAIASLQITYNPQNDLPIVRRNGKRLDWLQQFELYQASDGNSPISLGWQAGKLRVNTNNASFESTVLNNGQVNFSE